MKTQINNSPALRWMATLTVCSLALAAVGSVKNPVSRPVKGTGHVTVTINLSDGTWTSQDWGESTHTGRYYNHGSGHLDAQGTPVGGGTATGANGDQINWVSPGTSWEIEFTGGTGKFQNVTGGFNIVSQSTPVITFPDPGTMVMYYTYDAEGIVSY